MISKENLIAILESERSITPDQLGLLREKYLSRMAPFLERKEVMVLKGVRRSGKSTLMKQLMYFLVEKKLAARDEIAYISLEDYRLADSLTIHLLEQILELGEKKKGRAYLFLDEIQLISGWEKWVRTVYDRGRGVKFIISGSSASLLEKEYSAALTGRNITFQIRPFSFDEIAVFKEKKGNALLAEYLEFGGFPEVVLASGASTKKSLLNQYLSDIINRDIINRYGIRNARQVYLLAKYITSNVGQKISFNRIAKSFGLSVETVIRYVSYMEDAYLISEVPFHSYSVKTKYDQAKLQKIYLCDNGFINIMEASFSQNLDKKYENAVFIKLQERYSPTYWQDAKEVDFVFNKTGLNVTASDRIAPRELDGLKQIRKSDKNIERSILVTPNTSKNEGDVEIIPLASFLENADF